MFSYNHSFLKPFCIIFIIFFHYHYLTANPDAQKSNILFLMQTGYPHPALEQYQQYYEKHKVHDIDLLHRLSLILINLGAYSSDPESQLMALFGAGISMNEKTIPIFEKAISSEHPQLQLAAINFLSSLHHDEADDILNRAMSSPFLIIRLEALHHLASKKHPKALGQIESLMHKVEPELLPIFPEFYAQLGTPSAMRDMRRLLHNQNENTRLSVIINAAKYHCDDLLPQIRFLSSHHHPSQQEACAFALGALKDETSADKLRGFMQSSAAAICLNACYALFQLGYDEGIPTIQKMALKGDPFAIALLGEIPGNEIILGELIKSSNLQVRINACMALLEKNDSKCIPVLKEILIPDTRDLAFVTVTTLAKTLTAWKAIPSSTQNTIESPMLKEISLHLREEALIKAIELPSSAFIQIADEIFSTEQRELIPTTVTLLQSLGNEEAINLLKKYQQKVGSPFIRHYCNLALYRLNEPGPYRQILYNWVCEQDKVPLINFRPVLSWEQRQGSDNFQLTPEETSRLFIESLESLAKSQDEMGISAILHLIQYGHMKNRYALAGLLMRATE